MWRRRRGVTGWLAGLGKGSLFALCLIQPVAAVGAMTAGMWYDAYGPDNQPAGVIVIGLSVAALGLWVSSMSFFDFTVFDILGTVALMFAIFLPVWIMSDWVLATRGATVTCRVGHVEERVETSTDSDGHSTTTHYFDHEVRCPDGYPRMVTTTGKPAAEVEDRRRVTFDVQRRIDPVFGTVTKPIGKIQACAGLLAFVLVMRVLPWAINPDARYRGLNAWYF